MKKFSKLLTTALACGVLGAGAFAITSGVKAAKTEALHDLTYDKFVPMIADNFETASFLNLHEQFKGGHASYWTDRYYGTSEGVLDTVGIFGDKRGDFRTNWFKQTPSTADNKTYITFLLGGNTNNNTFINIWDENNIVRDRNIYSNIRNDFYVDGLNMYFRYFEMPTDLNGERMLLYFNEDGGTTGCEGITFADLRINQSFDDVVSSYRNFLLGYQMSAAKNSDNLAAYNAIMDLHNNNAYYAPLKAKLDARETLTNVDDDFEVNDRLSDWVLDWNYTTTGFNLDTIYSDAVAKVDGYFVNPMPFNKHGNMFLNEDANGFPEDQKYRLVSREFELGGVGLISAKLGGATAVLELLDADTLAVLASTDIHGSAEGNYVCNPGFISGSGESAHLDICQSGARLNTLTRVYLDCSAHVGKSVRVALTDGRTGGDWGKAYFDDVKTYYAEYPSFNVESISQTVSDVTHYSVVTDKYVGSSSNEFGEAYEFLQSFYSAVRNSSNGQSWCNVKTSDPVQAVISDYAELSEEAKAIVDSSKDYDFGTGATSANWYLSAPNLVYNVGQTMVAIETGVYPVPNGIGFLSSLSLDGSSYAIIIIVSFVVILTFSLFVILKKHKKQ